MEEKGREDPSRSPGEKTDSDAAKTPSEHSSSSTGSEHGTGEQRNEDNEDNNDKDAGKTPSEYSISSTDSENCTGEQRNDDNEDNNDKDAAKTPSKHSTPSNDSNRCTGEQRNDDNDDDNNTAKKVSLLVLPVAHHPDDDDHDQQEVLAAGLPALHRQMAEHEVRPGAVRVPGRGNDPREGDDQPHRTASSQSLPLDTSLHEENSHTTSSTHLVAANLVDSTEERERNAELVRLRQELAQERRRSSRVVDPVETAAATVQATPLPPRTTVVYAESVRREVRESTVIQCSRRRLWFSIALLLVAAAVVGIGLGAALFSGDDKVIVCFVSKEELLEAVDVYLDAKHIANSSDDKLVKPPFDRPIEEWCFSGIDDFSEVFSADRNALNQFFNANITSWDVSNATNMSHTFKGASQFNQPLEPWDVSRVVTMEAMFKDASSFNQDVARWNISAVLSFAGMFESALAFRQNLCRWATIITLHANVSRIFLESQCDSQEDPSPPSNTSSLQKSRFFCSLCVRE